MSQPILPETITCIYCKQQRSPSREHVLARSIGGNAICSITCLPCNRDVLSPLDQVLAERSLVSLSRVAYTPSTAFNTQLGGENFHHNAERDLYTELRIVNQLRTEPLPQIHLQHGTGDIMVEAGAKDAADALVAFVDKRLTNGTLRSLFIKVGPVENCTTSRLVMHRVNDGFVRVARQGDEVVFFDTLEKRWTDLREKIFGTDSFVKQTIEQPTIKINLSIRFDDVFRAVAKTVFNVLAMDIGPDFALRHEFDELREYILGRDIRHPTRLAPGQIAVDSRFVRMVSLAEPPLVPTDKHVVTLFYAPPCLVAHFTLYKVHSFVVRLGAITLSEEVSEQVLVAHEFSTVRQGHAALDVSTLYERLVHRPAGIAE